MFNGLGSYWDYNRAEGGPHKPRRTAQPNMGHALMYVGLAGAAIFVALRLQ